METISNQSITDYEIIIVDDGSTDRTKEIVKKFDVQLFEQNHKGPGAARNWGAKEAKGDILVFVDADMFFDRQFLENLIKPIQEKRAIGTFNKEEFVGNDKNTLAICWNLEHTNSPNRRISENYPDEAVIYRALLRSKFLEVGGFEIAAGYEDDATLYPKLGVKAQYAPGAISYHNNPGTFAEIYRSARWIGRTAKYAARPWTLIKYSFPLSLYYSIKKALHYRIPKYIQFKLVYDCGIFLGGMSRLVFGTHTK